MFPNTYGELFRITTFGESHGKGIGVVIDGCPANIDLSIEDIQKELDRRKPNQSRLSTMRDEQDRAEILSGVFEGKTTGTPITIYVENKEHRSQDYNNIKNIFRPSHADFTYFHKFGIRDYKGGGRASARETIGRVAAGAVAKKILSYKNIEIYAYTIQIENIKAENFNKDFIEQNILRTCDKNAAPLMEEAVSKARSEKDSVGGIIELIIKNMPVGIGEPVFDRLEARLAYALMSIPATKGVEFGSGFRCASMRGSIHNDEISKNGFLSNNAGGILGGISSGDDIVVRIALKPTPSIALHQRTIDIYNNDTDIEIKGRHDPCILPRAVPIIEAMAAVTILDLILIHQGRQI